MAVSTPLFLATDAQAYEHFMARWSRRLAGPFLDFAGVKTGARVLDVGCGTGVITAALAEWGCTVVGVDASEPYLEGARRDRSHPSMSWVTRVACHMRTPPSMPASRPSLSTSYQRSIKSSARCGG